MNHDASQAVILLMKGLFYREDNLKAWEALVGGSHGSITDYLSTIGLEPIVDEAEGYAYLRQKEPAEGEEPLPKLIRSRELSYKVSLLLVLLRKRIADFDMQSESTRAVVGSEELIEEMLLFMPQNYNEVKQRKELESVIKKAEDLGFLKKLKGAQKSYEIRRSIKAFVDAQWLGAFDEKLREYRELGQ